MKIIRKTVGFFTRNFFDVRGALGVNELKRTFSQLGSAAKTVFRRSSSASSAHETFEEAVKRMKLTDADLQSQYKNYQHGFYGYSLFSGILFFYSIYLIYTAFYNAAMVGFAVAALCLVFAFKRHFWMFQIRQRKLGCTFGEWMKGTFGKTK